jgi:clan AA aspartic protease
MGLIRVDVRLANFAKPELDEIDARALVDSGALHLCIPPHIALQLGLRTVEQREVHLADGKVHLVDYVAPVQVALLGRSCVTGALVLGDEVLLGAIPMEDMDLMIHPAQLRVIKNPESPNIAVSMAKGVRPSKG